MPADHRIFLSFQTRGVLTLPAGIRKRHHLDEPGAQVELVERDDGVIELHGHVPISAEQKWFWSDRWQRMEHEAEEDIAAGRVERFDSMDDFLSDLDSGD